jgi:hypothetical protein
MPQPLIRLIDQRQRRAWMSRLPARLTLTLAPQRPGSGLGERGIRRRRLGRVPAVLPQLPTQLRNLGLKPLNPLGLPHHQSSELLVARTAISGHPTMVNKDGSEIN